MKVSILSILLLFFTLQLSYSFFQPYGSYNMNMAPNYGANMWGNFGAPPPMQFPASPPNAPFCPPPPPPPKTGGQPTNQFGFPPNPFPYWGGPAVQGLKWGCPIEVTKAPKSSGQFGGFTDSFKEEMAYMITQITTVATPQAKALKEKVIDGLVKINNLLNMINAFPYQESQFKPELSRLVTEFLKNIDDIQDLLSCQTNVTVVGNNNAAYASTGNIYGNSNTVVGNKSTTIGNSNVVVGNSTIVAGNSNLVKGNNSITVGKNNNVTASNSYTFSNG